MSELETRSAPTRTDAPIRAALLDLERGGDMVLRSISLEIPAGAVVGLVGRNGAGKTSLLQCLAGLTVPTRGHASVLGCPAPINAAAFAARSARRVTTPPS